jgi:hypothetical protein
MVRPARAGIRGERGASRLGCLFSALVFATVLYYSVGIGGVYVRYWQLADEMNELATLAPSLDDATIHRRLVLKADDLGLPAAAHRFVIRRYDRPPEIRISTSYEETVELPFTRYTIHLHHEARAAL